jgi:hypothetical protein
MSGRKAWNEAMKKAASGTILRVPAPVSRRSGRSSTKNKRREKARKALNLGHGLDDDEDGAIDSIEFRLDSLEEASFDLMNIVDDDDEYDELEDFEEGGRGGAKKRRKRKTKKNASAHKSGTLPKRFKARSLASILIEESTRGESGILQQYLNAEARPSRGAIQYPRRKFCAVTGLEAVYKDPKTGIPYANLTAIDQIRERAPPWMGMNNTGTANYYEAVKSLKNEDS